MTWLALATVFVALFAGAVAERLAGLGLSLVAAPFLALAIGPVDTVRLLVLLALPINIGNALLLRHSMKALDVARIALPAVLLMPVFAIAVQHSPKQALTVLAGLACVVAAVTLALGVRVRLGGWLGAIAAGATSAGLNAVAGLSGPPVALYATNAGWTADRLRGNLQTYFVVLGLVAVPSLGLPHVSTEALVVAIAAAAIGFVVAALIAGLVSERSVRITVLALSAGGGLSAVVYGVLGVH